MRANLPTGQTSPRSRPTAPHPNQGDEEDEKGGILSDFSMSAVIASALAAATSLRPRRRSGMAGSVIGVGVAAAASIATQVWAGMLSASAKKIGTWQTARTTTSRSPCPADGRADAGVDHRAPSRHPSSPATSRNPSQTNVAETGTPIAHESPRRARARGTARRSPRARSPCLPSSRSWRSSSTPRSSRSPRRARASAPRQPRPPLSPTGRPPTRRPGTRQRHPREACRGHQGEAGREGLRLNVHRQRWF